MLQWFDPDYFANYIMGDARVPRQLYDHWGQKQDISTNGLNATEPTEQGCAQTRAIACVHSNCC